jgi:hypothetical protein
MLRCLRTRREVRYMTDRSIEDRVAAVSPEHRPIFIVVGFGIYRDRLASFRPTPDDRRVARRTLAESGCHD